MAGDLVASPMTGSQTGFNPPTNDWLNAAINFGGNFLPMGAGFGIDALKGIWQQTQNGTQANTNPMSWGESALYGPGMGERVVNWLANLFSGDSPATPADYQGANTQQGRQTVGNQPVNTQFPLNPNASPGVTPNQLNAALSGYTPDYTGLDAGNPSGTRNYYGTLLPSSGQPNDVIGGMGAASKTGALLPAGNYGGGNYGATQSTQPYTYNGMTANLNFDPNMLAAAINDFSKLPSLNFNSGSGPNTGYVGGFTGVGYAPGADFMTGFGSQAGGYEGGGSYPGMRTLVR